MPVIENQEIRGQVSTTFSEAPNSGLTVSCSSIKTCIIPVLVSFFVYFHTPFFDFGPVFKGDAQLMEKNLLNFQMQNFMLNLLKKKLFKNNHYSRSLLDPET